MTQPNKPAAKKNPVSPVATGIILLTALGLSAGWYFSRDASQPPAPEPPGQSSELPATTSTAPPSADTQTEVAPEI